MAVHDDIQLWLSRRPGVFEAPTERETWALAWRAFSGEDGSALAFILAVKEQGFDARPTCLGGWILDAKP